MARLNEIQGCRGVLLLIVHSRTWPSLYADNMIRHLRFCFCFSLPFLSFRPSFFFFFFLFCFLSFFLSPLLSLAVFLFCLFFFVAFLPFFFFDLFLDFFFLSFLSVSSLYVQHVSYLLYATFDRIIDSIVKMEPVNLAALSRSDFGRMNKKRRCQNRPGLSLYLGREETLLLLFLICSLYLLYEVVVPGNCPQLFVFCCFLFVFFSTFGDFGVGGVYEGEREKRARAF